MLLSTSNSDRRMQAGKWVRTWTAAAVCLLILLSGWEIFWRLQGFTPSVTDNRKLWAVERRKASRLGPEGVVLAGSSRIQMGLVPEVFQQYSGIRPIMLAIDGNSPIPVLDHLARDPGFDSRLIVSTIPMFLGEPLGDERSLKWVRDFSEQKWSSRIETHLAVFVEQNIAFRSSSLAPEELLEDLQKNECPSPICAPMRPDRYRPGYSSITRTTRPCRATACRTSPI